jgi:hypothetical protein
MLSLKWGIREARIWLDTLPDWYYQGTEIIEQQIESTRSDQLLHRSSAVELFIPIGGRFYDGALAVTFVPATAGPLVIQIPVLESEVVLQDALPGKLLDTLFIGIPRRYAEGIFEGILKTPIAQVLGSGTISVSGAAHGVIGSSPWMFHVLTRIAVHLLTLDMKDVSDQRLIEIIGEGLRQANKFMSDSRNQKNSLPA